MNILLLHPYTQHRTFCPPLGILYIAGNLRAHGYDVHVLDMDVDSVEDDALLQQAKALDPLFIGITCNIVQVPEVFRLARLLSEVGAPIVVGGPMPSAVPERILECSAIDLCVLSEGEDTIVELAEALRSGSELHSVAGLAYRKDGAIHRTPARGFITDLDRLPFPAHDLNGGIAKYAANPTPAPETPLAAVLPSRGCPFNCNFCSNPWKTTNRKRSVANVIEELRWLVEEFGVKQIFFYDDSFNSNPEYVRELCQAILDNGLKFGWRADCRANRHLVDLETLKLMKASGCWLLAFGVETGNKRIMKSLRKGLRLEDVVRARELCAQAGILFRSFFMIGCLGDTYKTVFDTIDFARRLNPDDPQFSIFSPIIGTEAYDIAKKNGWIIDESWEHLDSFHATVSTENLTARETRVLHALARLVVPQWWKASYEGQKIAVPDLKGEMRRRFGREGEMVTEMWHTYQRNPRSDGGVTVILNPPSPPGVTSGKDTMGGLGQTFKGENGETVPPVDMAYLAAKKRQEGVPIHVIDAVGSRLDEAHTLRMIESLEPAEILIRTSVPTLKFDETFAQKIQERTGVTPELFGPAVGKSLLDEADLDALPLPAWELFPEYNLGPLSKHRRYLPIQGSVGYPYACDYCPYPAAQGTKFRARKPENIVQEMRHFYETLGVDFFLFRDPVFTLNRKATRQFCDLLIEAGLPIQWRCETRADLLDEALLERMAQAGCVGINFGVESLSEEANALVHRKQIPQEQLVSVVKQCKRLGIEAFVFYIVGLPGETRASFFKTLEFARELDTPFVQFTPITAYPGTPLEQWARERGYLAGELSDPPHYGTEPLMRNESLTQEEIKELCEIAYRHLNTGESVVAVARCTDYGQAERAVAKAVAELGGIEAFVRPGQKVLLKPNLIGSYAPELAATTHPEILRAIIRLVKRAGATPVVGDSPGGGELPSYKHMRRLYEITGIAEVCESEGVEIVDFSLAGAENLTINGEVLKELTVSKAVLEADVIISLPKAKTHAFTYFTGALKNLYGVVPGLRKAEYHKLAPSLPEFSKLLNDIHDALKAKVRLILMDAVIGMDGNGPTAGQPRRGNCVIAGTESLTVDLAACQLLGLNYRQSPPLTEAIQRRVGQGNLQIRLVGDPPNIVQAEPFRAPLLQSQESFIETYGSVYPRIDQEACVQCGRCARACPTGTIQDFVIDWDNCIRCLCCFETCQHDAIRLVKLDQANVSHAALSPQTQVPIPAKVEPPPAKAETPPEKSRRSLAKVETPSPKAETQPQRSQAPVVVPKRRTAEAPQSMRILVLSNLYPPHFVGGYELACKEITDRLAARGHRMLVLTSMFGLEEPSDDLSEAIHCADTGYPVLRRLDHAYGTLQRLVGFDPPCSAYNEYLIRRILREFQPDRIYVWNFHGLGMFSVIQEIQASGIPYVFHAMDYHLLATELEAWKREPVREFLMNDRCHIIAMSETVCRKFQKEGYPNLSLIYHGVDLAEAPPERSRMRRLLYTGQIRPGKGVHVAINALIRLRESCPDLTLDIFGAGDENYERQIREFVEQHRLPVTFHGMLPREELLAKYREYDAFILPTLREEPFGIVMIEAMNAGLPVIASNAGGPTEVVTHGETGLLFPAGNAEVLSRMIHELYQDESRYRQMAANAYQLVQERFDIEKSVERIEGVLREGRTVQAQASPVASQAVSAQTPSEIKTETQPEPVPEPEERQSEEHRPEESARPPKAPKAKQSSRRKEYPLVWAAPVYDPSGYADEARNFLMALDRYSDLDLTLLPVEWSDRRTDLDRETAEILQRLSERKRPSQALEVYHMLPNQYRPNPKALFKIGRTMFETDQIPEIWVERCNALDEIWVPTEFNLETFARSGVSPEKLVKIPGVFPAHLYEQLPEPLPIEGKREFTFLTVFDWQWRKGWDVLFKAYFQEFRKDEGVLLVLKTYVSADSSGQFTAQLHERIEQYIRHEIGLDPAQCPPYTLYTQFLGVREMPRLYASADAYVMPSRGEGWGRPFMEAMACGLPVIGTRWSGNTEFMTDENAYLLDYRLVPVSDVALREQPLYAGHRWADPSVEHLRELMRRVFENREEARAKGQRAREEIFARYNWQATAERIVEHVAEISERLASSSRSVVAIKRPSQETVADGSTDDSQRSESRLVKAPRTRSDESPRILWEGPLFVHSSLARVNREIAHALLSTGQCELSLISTEPAQFKADGDPRLEALEKRLDRPLSGLADAHVRHQWPPNFRRPSHGKWVLMQPWEYGSMPAEWLPHLRDEIDEIWVYSHYNRNCYIEDGVPPEKIAVIPLGVDRATFHPDQPAWPKLRQLTQKGIVFLFVGGSIWRKGIDILLDAYRRAFTRKDDVTLIIKDFGNASFYKGQTAEQQIREIQADPNAPEIIHLTEVLSDQELAQLYRASTCLVHPYRGEGFGLPVAEAMACGCPVILSQGGACDDFTPTEVAYWIETERAWLQMEQKTVNRPWVLQPDGESLIAQLRHVAAHPEEATQKGQLAAAHVHETLRWENTARIILERLGVAQTSSPPLHAALWANERGKQLASEEAWEAAIQEFLRATRIAPDWGEPWSNLAVIAWNQGRYEDAVQYLKQGLERDPENEDLTINYALITEQIGESQRAIQILQDYLRQHPDADGVKQVLDELQAA